MRMFLPAATALSLVILIACASHAPGDDPAARFHTQLDDDWKYWMTQYPELATSVGYPGQDARWTDYSPSAIEARNTYLRQSLDRLKPGIDRSTLPAADQVTFDLYFDLLQSAVEGLEFHNDANPIKGVVPHNLYMPLNQMEGIHQDIPRTIALMPAATRDDYEHILARLTNVGPLVDQTIALMKQGMLAGLTPPKVTMRDVP